MENIETEERNLYNWLKNYNRDFAEKYNDKFKNDDYTKELRRG